ncbi:MAG TPA: hypothetical protein HPQ04_06380 [Rhodospirillaceae bacterium]|nr:hypothetical protein [Rhodospirillaceae bacterium]
MRRLTAAVVVLLGLTTAAQASVIYDYVGNPIFQASSGGIQYGTNISAQLVFSDALPANFTGAVTRVDNPNLLLSFSIQDNGTNDIFSNVDGQAGIYGNSGYAAQIYFQNGQITQWTLYANNGSVRAVTQNQVGVGITDGGAINSGSLQYPNGAYSGNTDNPGTWTQVSPVPLPAALPMFGAALVGLGGLAARRRKAQRFPDNQKCGRGN